MQITMGFVILIHGMERMDTEKLQAGKKNTLPTVPQEPLETEMNKTVHPDEAVSDLQTEI